MARLCARWLSPIVPAVRPGRGGAERGRAALGRFHAAGGAAIREPRPLVRKVEDADVHKLASRFVSAEAPFGGAAKAEAKSGPVTPEMTIEQFSADGPRAGKVLAAERVPKKDKLLKLTIDIGEPGRARW